MEGSTISQHQRGRRRSAATSPEWRLVLGSELRHERTARGLTQAALGAPLTRAFVSAVEHGRAVPSLAALELMLQRIDVPLSAFFARVEARMGSPAVDQDLTAAYDPRHGDRHL